MISIFNVSVRLTSILLIILFLPVITYANYTITPVKIYIKPGSMMSSLTVKNNNDMPRYFQVRIYAVDSSGKDIETKDVISSPSMFKSKARKNQIVRIAVKNPDIAFKQQKYVMSIKELPHGEVENNTVKFVTDFRVPIFLGEEYDLQP